MEEENKATSEEVKASPPANPPEAENPSAVQAETKLSSVPSSQKTGRSVPTISKSTVDPATYDLRKLLGREPIVSDTEAAKAQPGSKPSHVEERAAARPSKPPQLSEEYTFAPATNIPKDAELRSHEEFYKSQLAYKEAVLAKTSKLKEEHEKQEQDQLSFKPLISPRSVEIAQQRTKSEPLHDRLLHQRAFERTLPKGAHSEEGLFEIPEQVEIKKSRPRNSKQMEKIERSNSEEPQAEPKISEQSHKLLERRFKSEFQLHWNEVGAAETLRYFQFVELLVRLSLISKEEGSTSYQEERIQAHQLWRLLVPADEGLANKQHVYAALKATLGYYQPSQVEGEHDPWTGVGYVVQGKLYLGDSDVDRLRRDFSCLSEHRTKLFRKHVSISPDTHSYHPRITAKTKQIFEVLKMGREADSAHDFLYKDAMMKEDREIARKQKLDSETTLKECTFAPKTNARSERLIGTVKKYVRDNLSAEYIRLATSKDKQSRTELLYSLSSVSKARKEKVAKTQAQNEEDKDLVHCTFHPTTNGDTKVAAAAPPRGSEKMIERMQKAREHAEWVKAHRELGKPYSGPKKPAQQAPKSDLVKTIVTLELEVKLQNGETDVLRYRTGENVEEVVRGFAEKRCKMYAALEPDAVAQLQAALNEYVKRSRSKAK